jgi:beta-N-acetylhexosaminidase
MSISSRRGRAAFALITAGAAGAAVLALAAGAAAGTRPAAGAGAVAGLVKPAAAATAAGQPPGAAVPGAAALQQLDAWQLAGQHVIYSYPGLTPPSGLLSRICMGQVAGVIFFSANYSSRAQIAGVIKQLNQADACPGNPVHEPLILETDQEGGQVRRLPGAPVLSEKQIGESSDPAAAASSAGTGAGDNLLSVGMNTNAAPVVDFYRQPGDFYDQYQRSYSMNANTAGALGADFITAQQATGVAATAKHFPGLASATASQDTDVEPVTLWDHLDRIRGLDELPYESAIAAGVKLVMLDWAVYPNIGSREPAGLSTKVIKGELRGRLGFTGVTETDAIEAGALRAFGSTGSRAVQAAVAGDDLILSASQHVRDGAAVMAALVAAERDGTLNLSDFQASAARIIALRSTLPAG